MCLHFSVVIAVVLKDIRRWIKIPVRAVISAPAILLRRLDGFEMNESYTARKEVDV